jgi:hypothetical protein
MVVIRQGSTGFAGRPRLTSREGSRITGACSFTEAKAAFPPLELACPRFKPFVVFDMTWVTSVR